MTKKISPKQTILRGIVSSLIASLCCVTPLVFVLIGAGGLSIALSFLRYRPYFLSFGVIFLSVATYFYLKRDYGKCDISAVKKAKYSIVGSFALMVFLYVVITYFLVPPVLVSSVENKIQQSNTNLNASYQNATEIKIKISGMTCRCNVADIEYNLMQINGVLNATVNYDTSTGTIIYDSTRTTQYTVLSSKIFSGPYSAQLIS